MNIGSSKLPGYVWNVKKNLWWIGTRIQSFTRGCCWLPSCL